ncbi:MAG: DUF4252 domain-containing protein [Ignavibacteriales bacterium]|nr:DUF4252 domain-containing protein [Ignavibacteriales bacterium]
MKSTKLFIVLFFVLSVSSFAQQKEDYSKYPGFFNYKEIAGLKNAESLSEVYLEETLLKMVSGMAQKKSDDVSDMIGGLKLVQVNEYKIPTSEITDMESSLDVMDKSLKSKGWDRIVRTNNQSNLANIYVKKASGGEFEGLAILSLSKKMEDGENEKSESYGKVTCVNIVGKIDLSKLGNLTKELNLPGFDKMKGKEKEKDKE